LPEAGPAPARFIITGVANAGIDINAKAVDWTLSIEDPSATRALDTTKIAVSREPGRVEYYSDGEWSDRGPRLVGAALVRSFENTGRILGVGNRVTLPRADFILQTDIREMHAIRLDGKALVKTSIYVRLTNGKSKVYSAKLFSKQSEISDDSSASVARQTNTNLSPLLNEITEWTFSEVEQAQAQITQAK